MVTVTVNGTACRAEAGARLTDCLPAHAAPETPCGGAGRCGKCRVVARGVLSEPSPEELRALSANELARGVRLACCARALGDCEVLTGTNAPAFILGESGALPAPAPMFSGVGAAVDIGTTTLAACLYGPSGTLLAQAGKMNPQRRWGADVISRIEASRKGEGEELARAVREGINELLAELCAAAGLSADAPDALVITGNTAMLYLLTGSDPDCLAHAPFVADRLFGETLTGADLGLCCPGAAVYLPRCVSAFVGADTATALLAAGLTQRPGVHLLADIGTNGEIALWDGRQLSCCSTAAGPAFEGAGLSMGMPGRAGAVDHVTVENGALSAHVLGGGEAEGICGSGVVDALACLLATEVLDESGLLDPEPAPVCGKVQLTQKDVRAVQLAKSAVAAGLVTLTRTAGLGFDRVESLSIAGGFGSYLDVKNAGAIGLIPQELVPRTRILGNAALRGAAMLLLDRTLCARCEETARRAETIDLASSKVFFSAYTDCMFF